MNEQITLPLEKQFLQQSTNTQIRKMSAEQAQEFAIALYEQLLVREMMYQQMLKKYMLGVE